MRKKLDSADKAFFIFFILVATSAAVLFWWLFGTITYDYHGNLEDLTDEQFEWVMENTRPIKYEYEGRELVTQEYNVSSEQGSVVGMVGKVNLPAWVGRFFFVSFFGLIAGFLILFTACNWNYEVKE